MPKFYGRGGSHGSPWGQLFTGQRGKLALGLLILQFASAVAVFTFSTIMPAVSEELDGHQWYGFATSSTILATILTVPLAGPLMQRFGLKRTIYVATPIFVVGIALAGLAPNMSLFIVGQALRGAAGSILGVLSLSAMVSNFPSELRSRMIALSSSMWIVPAFIGPAYAALVAEALSWRWAILFLVPLIVLARVLVASQLSVFPDEDAQAQGLPVKQAMILGMGAVCLLSASGLAGGWRTTVIILGALLVVSGLARLFPPGTFLLRRGRPAAILAMFLLAFAFYGAESLVTLMATTDLQMTMLQGGAALTAGAVLRSCASLIQPRLIEHPMLGLRRTATLGAIFVFVALGGLASNFLVDWPPSMTLTMLWTSWAIGGFGMGLCYAPLTLAAFDHGAERQATSQATSVTLAETTGAMLGMAVGGLLLNETAAATGEDGVTTVPYLVFFAFMLPVILAARRVRLRAT